MSCFTLVVIAIACTAAAVGYGFIWLNRNKADKLDAAEAKVRDFKKP